MRNVKKTPPSPFFNFKIKKLKNPYKNLFNRKLSKNYKKFNFYLLPFFKKFKINFKFPEHKFLPKNLIFLHSTLDSSSLIKNNFYIFYTNLSINFFFKTLLYSIRNKSTFNFNNFFFFLNNFIFLKKWNKNFEFLIFKKKFKTEKTYSHSLLSRFNSFIDFSNFLKSNKKTSNIFKQKKNNKLTTLFLISRLIFKNFSYKFNNLSIFKISKYEWINSETARLTRSTLNINLNTFFKLKKISTAKLFPKNLNTVYLKLLSNDLIKENFFFMKNVKEKKIAQPFSFIKSFKTNFNLNHISKPFFLNLSFSKKQFNLFLNLNYHELVVFFFFNPLFFKFFNRIFNNKFKLNYSNLVKNINESIFFSKNNTFFLTNLLPVESFSFIFKKKILKVFNYSKFASITSIWHYNVLIRFFEFLTGKKVYFKIFNFLQNKLSMSEKSQCLIWSQKVKYFRKVLGPRLFLNESLQIIYLSLKYKDPFLLSNWMASTMQKISFWKLKTFLRYIKYVLRYFFWVIFRELNIKGVKFQLKGKISVAGNGRKRTAFHTVGFTSHTTFNNKILYKLNLVRTFTGVLGFKVWIVF